jgi:23S rRNA (adenine2503-C2)-methyltransferase
MAALRAYPLPPRRRITIEYTLVAGKNDEPGEAQRLVKLLRGLPVKINLIPMNPIELALEGLGASSGEPDSAPKPPLGPPSWGRVLAFQKVLTDAGYTCFIRRRRGDDVSAACGQLVLLGAKPKVKGFRKEHAPDEAPEPPTRHS